MKRLYRNTKEGKVAGICAGIGEVYNIDPTIVRLVAVFLCILTGVWPLVVAYLVGWFIIPDKEEMERSERQRAREAGPEA